MSDFYDPALLKKAGAHNRRKDACPAGHPYNEANTYVYPSGARACRTCNRLSRRRRAGVEIKESEYQRHRGGFDAWVTKRKLEWGPIDATEQ